MTPHNATNGSGGTMTIMTSEHKALGLTFTCATNDKGDNVFEVVRDSDGVKVDRNLVSGRLLAKELAESWIAVRVGAVSPNPTRCGSCSVVLESAMGYDTVSQFAGALWVTFSGGYGMYIDPITQDDPRVVLCGECVDELAGKMPWVAAVLRDGAVWGPKA